MTNLITTRHKKKFSKAVAEFNNHHHYAAFFVLLIVMPVFLMLCVFTCAFVIIYPMSFVFGWL